MLEVAIVIAILTVFSGIFIKKFIIFNKASKLKMVTENINTLELAISAFILEHNRLPRPSADENGIEQEHCTINNCVGFVPYISLGLQKHMIYDQHQKLLKYIVEPTLTENFDTLNTDSFGTSNSFASATKKLLTIKYNNKVINSTVLFIIDSEKNITWNITDVIVVKAANSSKWMTKEMFFIKYLSNNNTISKRQQLNADQKKFVL